MAEAMGPSLQSDSLEPLQKPDARAEVRRSIVSGSQLTTQYLVMNSLATVVATYGLLADSTAVVIGAMIIALLLGPIMGLALALVDGDSKLFRHSITAEVVGVALVLILSAIVARVHPDLPLTQEILSRTRPNLLDLAIALAGGAAGAYATVSPRVSAGLVGVAISTALLPPLAAAGICLSKGLYPQAGGALILFLTNLVAIQCAGSIVLYSFGFHNVTHRQKDQKKFNRRLAIDAGIFVSLAVFLYFQLSVSVDQRRFESRMRDRLQLGLASLPGAYLAETRFVKTPYTEVVIAVVQVPYSIGLKETARLEAMLGDRNGRPVELHVRSMITKETTSRGYLHEIAPNDAPVDQMPGSRTTPGTAPGGQAPDSAEAGGG